MDGSSSGARASWAAWVGPLERPRRAPSDDPGPGKIRPRPTEMRADEGRALDRPWLPGPGAQELGGGLVGRAPSRPRRRDLDQIFSPGGSRDIHEKRKRAPRDDRDFEGPWLGDPAAQRRQTRVGAASRRAPSDEPTPEPRGPPEPEKRGPAERGAPRKERSGGPGEAGSERARGDPPPPERASRWDLPLPRYGPFRPKVTRARPGPSRDREGPAARDAGRRVPPRGRCFPRRPEPRGPPGPEIRPLPVQL